MARRKSARIYVMPGVERRDLLLPISSEHVLRKSIEKGVTDAIVVGRDRTGELYVATGCTDADKATGLLLRAITMLTSSRIDNDQQGQSYPDTPA